MSVLQQSNHRWWNWLIPARHEVGSSWTHTHPSTSEQVRRLRTLPLEQQHARANHAVMFTPFRFTANPARWRHFGVWS